MSTAARQPPEFRIPDSLTECDQWVLWRYEDRNGKRTKVPYDRRLRFASSTDPSTWCTFQEALEAWRANPRKFSGIGFVFTESDEFSGVDLDACLDDSGSPKPWAQPIIEMLADTYGEISPSGRGIKFWVKAKLTAGIKRAHHDGAIEIYSAGRFFTVTGNVFGNGPLQVEEHQRDIDNLVRMLTGSEKPKPKADIPALETIGEGHRHQYLNSVAAQFGVRGMSSAEVFAATQAVNLNRCKPPKPEAEVRAICEWVMNKERGKPKRVVQMPAAPAVDECFAEARERLNPNTVNGDLPKICVNNRQLRDISAEALAAIQKLNRNVPFLFVRGGMMVAVVKDEKRRYIISEVNESSLRGWLTRSANYFKTNAKGNEVEGPPPIEVVRDILSLPPSIWEFQPLDAVVEAPVLRPDGTILETPGYDPRTKLLYAPDPDLVIPELPEYPTGDHLDAGLAVIDRAIGEFPFVDAASKANAIAAMLSPIIKPAIDAPAPMALFDAPMAGTGKSLLADVVSIIATGRPGEMFSAPRDDDEWRKQITMALLSGTSVVVIDNVNRRLDNPDLCKALTETTHVDRTFRTHQKMTLPVKATWIATGNNVQVGGDMPRRCYWVRLDAKESRPFMRTGFKIDDLKTWVSKHRGELLAVLLNMARAWYVAGSKKPRFSPTVGSYEAWSITVGGILDTAGVEGFLGNSAALQAEADTEAVQWEAFLATLDEVFYSEAFTIAEVVAKLKEKSCPGGETAMSTNAATLRAAMPDFLAEAMDRDGFFQRRAGKAFAERVGRRYGDSQIFLQRAGVAHKVQQWKVTTQKQGG